MARIPENALIMRIAVDVELSFWQAFKLRLAGASYVEGYLKCLMEERFERQREDDE